MRYALLIAWREFCENVRTKGFWIGICMFPLMLGLFSQVPMLLERRATPTRHFVLIDPSGEFQPVILRQLERFHQRRILRALNEYAVKNRRDPGAETAPRPALDLENLPAPGEGPEKILEQFAENNPGALDAFSREGGLDGILKQVQPFLRIDAPAFKPPPPPYQQVPAPPGVKTSGSFSNIALDLKPFLSGDRKVEVDGKPVTLFAAVLVPPDLKDRVIRPGAPPDLTGRRGIEYWAANLADNALHDEIERAVNAEIRQREYRTRGVDPVVVRTVERTAAPMTKLDPRKAAGKERVSMADTIRQWAPSGFVYLLWVAIFSVAQMLLNNTIEEKSNRIIEVLLSSVTAGELMAGKLLGIMGVGLAMVGTWIGMLLAFLIYKAGPEAEFARQLLIVIRDSQLLPTFGLYFLLGYLLYGGIILSLGSVCNTLKEAQNFMVVVMLLLMVPLLTMTFIPKDPHGTLARVLSWIPIYTPFVMMNRAAANPPRAEVLGTLAVLVLTTVTVLWAAGRIFRAAILRTGQPPRWRELLRWLHPRNPS